MRLPESDCRILIKLADYGTADLDPGNLGKPVDVCHFTTLENTPMEFLLFSDAPQSFAADTFQLGLSILHALTGASPYEEILELVRCPVALMEAVAMVWEEGDDTEFETLRCVLRDDDDNVLYHTLYRYLVLFGLTAATTSSNSSSNNRFSPMKSKVFTAIVSVLGKSEAGGTDGGGKESQGQESQASQEAICAGLVKILSKDGHASFDCQGSRASEGARNLGRSTMELHGFPTPKAA